MSRNPNKLLIALLVLLIAIAPISGVFAGSHACARDAGQRVAAEDMVHGDHGHFKDTGDARSESPAGQSCDGCDRGCCQGGMCSMGHCAGTAAALQKPITLEFERFSASESTLTGDRPFAGRLAPPFRPPQA